MKDFNWEEFKIENIVVNCKTEKEAKNFINECIRHGIVQWLNGCILNEILTEWNIYKEATCYNLYHNSLCYSNKEIYKNDNYKIIEWSDYMKETQLNDTTKKQYNLIKLSELPNGSKLYFERGNTKIHVYIDDKGIIKYEDTDKPFIPYKDNLKATFTLVSLPPKEVLFNEAVEHYSKGGNIKSVLYSIEKTYVGLKTDNTQKRGLISDNGIHITVDEILNAKWYIVD